MFSFPGTIRMLDTCCGSALNMFENNKIKIIVLRLLKLMLYDVKDLMIPNNWYT